MSDGQFSNVSADTIDHDLRFVVGWWQVSSAEKTNRRVNVPPSTPSRPWSCKNNSDMSDGDW